MSRPTCFQLSQAKKSLPLPFLRRVGFEKNLRVRGSAKIVRISHSHRCFITAQGGHFVCIATLSYSVVCVCMCACRLPTLSPLTHLPSASIFAYSSVSSLHMLYRYACVYSFLCVCVCGYVLIDFVYAFTFALHCSAYIIHSYTPTHIHVFAKLSIFINLLLFGRVLLQLF